MRLLELFEIPADTKDKRLSQDIDYAGDLKFFIDNDNELLSKYFFPVVKDQSEHLHSPDFYKHYLKPVKHCAEIYLKKYDLDDIKDQIFTPEALTNIAKRFAEEQKGHIESGEYDR